MKNFYTAAFILILISGCENVNVITPEADYHEYIVVRSEFQAYTSFKGVSFTRTLPLNEDYDIKKTELKNVAAYLKVNGIRVFTLRYLQDGVYVPLDSIYIQPGSTYELFAEYNNTKIYSMTKVPLLPKIISATLTNNRFIEVAIRPNEGEVYGAGWEIYNPITKNLFDEANDFKTIVQPSETEIGSSTIVATKDLPGTYTSGNYNGLLYVQVYAFDLPYLKYFKTKNNNQPSENAFAQGGDQVAWNVRGDHVIGLFIGFSVLKYNKVN